MRSAADPKAKAIAREKVNVWAEFEQSDRVPRKDFFFLPGVIHANMAWKQKKADEGMVWLGSKGAEPTFRNKKRAKKKRERELFSMWFQKPVLYSFTWITNKWTSCRRESQWVTNQVPLHKERFGESLVTGSNFCLPGWKQPRPRVNKGTLTTRHFWLEPNLHRRIPGQGTRWRRVRHCRVDRIVTYHQKHKTRTHHHPGGIPFVYNCIHHWFDL